MELWNVTGMHFQILILQVITSYVELLGSVVTVVETLTTVLGLSMIYSGLYRGPTDQLVSLPQND